MSNILYVITDLEVGGVPLHLYHLALAMRDRGFVPTVVSLAPVGPVGDRLSQAGIEVLSCDGRGGRDFRVVGRLSRVIAERKPDIVHALLFHANFAARRAAGKAGLDRRKVLCEIQTVEVERRWHLWVDRFTHRGCRLTIGNSPSVIDHLAERARFPRNRLRLIRGGVRPERIDDAKPMARAQLGLSEADRIVLWVGRLDPVKGLETLIGAFGQVPLSLNAHLMLAGDGPFRQTLERQVQRENLGHRVHLLGSRDDVPSLLKSADVFAFPSRTEGLPNALLEAMTAGCPIVTTDVPGCRDLIEHNVNGLVVPYGDTDALRGALQRLLEDAEPARALGQKARHVALNDWPISRTYDEYARLYAEVLAEA